MKFCFLSPSSQVLVPGSKTEKIHQLITVSSVYMCLLFNIFAQDFLLYGLLPAFIALSGHSDRKNFLSTLKGLTFYAGAFVSSLFTDKWIPRKWVIKVTYVVIFSSYSALLVITLARSLTNISIQVEFLRYFSMLGYTRAQVFFSQLDET